MKPLTAWLVLLMLGSTSAFATSAYLVADVPLEDPGGGSSIYLPWEVIRRDSGSYSLLLQLPDHVNIDAIHRMNDGSWLFSVDTPVDLGGMSFDRRDVVRFDSNDYYLHFDGAVAGVPPGSDVDAVFLEGGDSGDLILSFDVTTVLGATTHQPSDLVRWNGTSFSSRFDGSQAGLGSDINVTGADLRSGSIVLTFDLPVLVGVSTFLPGEIVAWNGLELVSLDQDSSWPVSRIANGCSLLAAPGSILATLRVGKDAVDPDQIVLTWSASCSAGAENYGVYAGNLARPWAYDHTAADCDNQGILEKTLATGPGEDLYFLIVPFNSNDEGSYGPLATSAQRPLGQQTCAAEQELESCPGS